MSDALNVNGGPEAVAALLRRLGALGAAYKGGADASKERIAELMDNPRTFGNDRIGQQGKANFPDSDAVFENRAHLAGQLKIIAENGIEALGSYGTVDDYFADQHRNVEA
ncbi:hypothetical protein [Saccharopolyspora elongata]|uniref:Uncharacterized protein n=1 Tax=Saccharopolyspora elongata TaxID=2530387 RepID=A0A4R4XWM3_9PSEU|nr:hypothetical protein [Saccharopolyspora elongata]TDD35935.1 hypothetical protein E1288_42570 [Saccharopolyspora elongata]